MYQSQIKPSTHTPQIKAGILSFRPWPHGSSSNTARVQVQAHRSRSWPHRPRLCQTCKPRRCGSRPGHVDPGLQESTSARIPGAVGPGSIGQECAPKAWASWMQALIPRIQAWASRIATSFPHDESLGRNVSSRHQLPMDGGRAFRFGSCVFVNNTSITLMEQVIKTRVKNQRARRYRAVVIVPTTRIVPAAAERPVCLPGNIAFPKPTICYLTQGLPILPPPQVMNHQFG